MIRYVVEDTKVVEVETDQIISVKKDETSAKKMASQLNGGLGFIGHTPAFILQAAS